MVVSPVCWAPRYSLGQTTPGYWLHSKTASRAEPSCRPRARPSARRIRRQGNADAAGVGHEFNVDGRPDPGNWTYEAGLVRNEELQWYGELSL